MRPSEYGGGLFGPLALRDYQALRRVLMPGAVHSRWAYARHCVVSASRPGAVHVCPIYWCPTSGENESPCHGGFDVCCDHPELHEEPRDVNASQ